MAKTFGLGDLLRCRRAIGHSLVIHMRDFTLASKETYSAYPQIEKKEGVKDICKRSIPEARNDQSDAET